MRRWLIRGVISLVTTVGLTVLLLLAEVQLARMGPRLDDEDGARPVDLLVGSDRAGDPLVLFWLGDSTTTGVGVSDFEDSMAFRVAAQVSSAIDVPVSVNVLGVSGARLDDVLDEQVSQLSVSADLVLVSVGANDVNHLTRRPAFRRRYRRLLADIADRAPAAEVVAVGVPDMGSVPRFLQPLRSLAGWRGDALDGDIADAAADAGISHVDLAGETGPAFRSDPGRYFAEDDFHPAVDGHALWADAVIDDAVAAARVSVG